MRCYIMKLGMVGLGLLMVAACGRKGPLVPPEALVPAPIADLRVEQKGRELLVSWSRPSAEEGGGALKDLAGFQLFRREVLPPGEDCEECPTAYRLIKIVDLEYPQGIVAAGNRYLFFDSEPVEGKTYRYKALSLKKDGAVSRASNQAGRKKVAPPLPPVLKGTSSELGVILEWKGIAPPASGRIEGYNIYRKQSGDTVFLSPLTSTPVRETTYEDKQLEWGKRYDYAVRTVAMVDGETVESALSNAVQGALADTD